MSTKVKGDFSDYTDEELKLLIKDGIDMRNMQESKGWKMLETICGRQAEASRLALTTVDPTNLRAILNHQLTIKFYGNILTVVNGFMDSGEIAFEEQFRREHPDLVQNKRA
jgi:hypothetical protein